MGTKKNLNQKIAELDHQVEWFHSEEFELGQAVAKYQQAAKLAREIEKDLAELKNEIEVLAEDFTK